MTSVDNLPEPSSSAERMRLFRERRRKGLTCITVQLRESEIAALMERGFLDPVHRNNRVAIAIALHRYLDRNPILGTQW
jgi:hypothetical protein